jgi:multidrug resistance efflux pump
VADQPRFLAPVAGYTANPAAAIDKLEAVDADEQARQTALAQRRAELDRRQEWMRSRDRIRAELDRLREVFGSFVSSDLRVIRHQLDRIDARVRAR